MGVDKAMLAIDGVPFAVRAARALTEACERAVEVGRGVSGLPSTVEDPPGSGPLAALVAGAHALETSGPVLLLACDLPLVEAPLLRFLAERPGTHSVVPVTGGVPQYVCARYGVAALATAVQLLASGKRALRDIAANDCELLPESIWRERAPEAALADVDTPEDLHRLGLP